MRASDIQEIKSQGSKDEHKPDKNKNCTKAYAKTKTNKEM
jgi:hypothetical protein